MKRIVLGVAAAVLAGCQSTPSPPTARAFDPDAAHALYTRLTDLVKSCWFAGDAAFTDYNYSPEINANAPRILIVAKSDPHGRPLLVIEPRTTTSADVYGPLLGGPAAPRVRADLDRWLKGASTCA